MYVAVKGGERAIDNAHRLLAEKRRGNRDVAEISAEQISEQLTLGVDRVMSEGSLYDRGLAALAIKQARGDMIEAVFLVRASRTTLARYGYSQPLDTNTMEITRRISATFKDLPGGQVLGPTFDYTHRLLDRELEADTNVEPAATAPVSDEATPHVLGLLDRQSLIEPALPASHEDQSEPGDMTRDPLTFPVDRDVRLQMLARGDEGFLLALGYSTQRGYARNHPFAGEIRVGTVEVSFVPEELGFAICLGEIEITECEMVNQFTGSKSAPPQFTRGYGISFGHCERKAMSMAQVDRALRAGELDEDRTAPAQDEEFVLSHCDNVQATGFVEHLKLPHYVDFQSELDLVRRMRREQGADQQEAAE